MIETLGFRLIQVPGLVEIRIEPSDQSAQGVHVVLDDGQDPRTYGLEELKDLARSLTEAVKLGEVLAKEIDANARSVLR